MNQPDTAETCQKTVSVSRDLLGAYDETLVERDLDSEGCWHCPHDPVNGTDRCVFHQDPAAKTKGETTEALCEALECATEESDIERSRRLKQFLGANFSDLHLSGSVFKTGDNHPIVLGEATIDGSVNLSESTFEIPLLAPNISVSGPFIIDNAQFHADFRFDDSSFDGEFSANNSRFDRQCSLREATFEGDVSAGKARFSQETNFTEASFHGWVGTHELGFNEGGFTQATFAGDTRFSGATFDHGANFEGAVGHQDFLFTRVTSGRKLNFTESTWNRFVAGGLESSGTISFRDADFEERAEFAGARCSAGITFRGTTFQELASFRDARLNEAVFDNVHICRRALFTRSVFQGGQTYFRKAVFDGETDWTNASFNDADFSDAQFSRTSFEDVTFTNGATFDNSVFQEPVTLDVQSGDDLSLTGATFEAELSIVPDPSDSASLIVVDCSKATVPAGELAILSDAVFFDLSHTHLGRVKFESGLQNAFDQVRIEETVFDGFDFREAAHRRFLRAADWELHRLGPRSDAAGIATVTDPEELEATYNNLKAGADAIADNKAASRFFFIEKMHAADVHRSKIAEGSWLTNLRSRWDLCSNMIFRLIAGYGERPLRVLTFSASVIVVFAIIFAYRVPSPEPYTGYLGYLILSFESFITLVRPGAPRIDDQITTLIAQFEGFLGAFSIALFVFTLTRALKR